MAKKKKKTPKPRKGKATVFGRALSGKIDKVRTTNKRKRVKPPYLNPYLVKCVADALDKPVIDKATVRDHNAPVVVVDVRKVVGKVKDTLHLRPDNTLRARLITLSKIDKDVAKLGYLRFIASNHPDAVEGHEDAYKVILYRQR